MDAADEALELVFACADEIHLPRKAFPRSDALGFPGLFDFTPSRLGEAFQKAIRGILDRDRAIEIEQNSVQACEVLKHSYGIVSKMRAKRISVLFQ